MLCYDRAKCGVISGPQLARLTQRRKGSLGSSFSTSLLVGSGGNPSILGDIGNLVDKNAGTITDQIKNFFSDLFGSAGDKQQFDSVRQNVWNQFAAIVDAVDNLKRSGQLTREQLQGYMRSLKTLIENFNAYYNRVRAAVTPAYGDSRFHDFYDVFQAKYNEWNSELAGMPSGGLFSGLTNSLSNISGEGMLMLGALALAIYSGSRRRRA